MRDIRLAFLLNRVLVGLLTSLVVGGYPGLEPADLGGLGVVGLYRVGYRADVRKRRVRVCLIRVLVLHVCFWKKKPPVRRNLKFPQKINTFTAAFRDVIKLIHQVHYLNYG